MKKLSIITILSFSIGILIGYYIPTQEETSFYGIVTEITESNLHIQGIPENDISHRGAFILHITSKTKIIGDNSSISISDIPIHSTIQISYTGSILESYPAQINNVTEISIIE